MPPERRAHPRKRLDQLAYIGFGADTGGVLLDLSEEGLRCQIVGAVVQGDRCRLKFALPGRHSTIEADGEVVWANRSRQGGGVRLVSLGPDAREDLQQWLRDAIASPSPARPSPVPMHVRTVGAVHIPEPTRKSAEPVAVVDVPPTQSPVTSPQEPTRLIEHEPLPVSELVPANEGAVKAAMETPVPAPTYIAPEDQTPAPDPVNFDVQADPGPIAKTAEPVAAAVECASAPAVPVAPAASVTRKPVPHTPEPRAMQTPTPERRAALAYSQPAPEKGRFTRVLVLTGCIVAGITTLAVSGFDPAILQFGAMTAEIAPPTIAPPTPPKGMTELESTVAPAEPVESVTPSGRESSDVPVRTPAPQIVRPQPPAARATAPNRPAQNATPARPANRPQLTLSVPRLRTTSPAPPAAAVPQMPLTSLVPEAPLVDMSDLENRAPELPQPEAGYQPPQLLSQVEPVYSTFARQQRMQGTVRVNAKVGIDGVPRSPICVAGNGVLCQMALEAIRKWRYQPAISDGRPVEAQVLVSFNFQLR